AAHFWAAVGAARTRGGAPTSQRRPTAPTNHTGRARDVISGMNMLPRRWTDLDRSPAILADTGVTLTRPEHVGQGNPVGLEGARRSFRSGRGPGSSGTSASCEKRGVYGCE